MPRQEKSWSENTAISIGFAIAVIGGGGWWAADTSSTLTEQGKRLDRQSTFMSKLGETTDQIKIDVATIKAEIRGNHGFGPGESSDSGDSASGTQGQDVPGLSRRLRALRTGHASDTWPGLDGRPAQDLDDRS